MSATNSNDAVIFCSRYTHGVDEKRRLQIPAKWRPSDTNTELMLIVWDGNGAAGSCLRVYPPQQMQALMQKVAAMSTSDQEAVALRRNIAKKSEWVSMDKAGRICIPDALAAEAGITGGKTVALAGALQWFEIWDEDRYAKVNAGDNALLTDAMRHL
ncbi:MAG: hypothetical protein EXS31_02055 [Pedosphaera sp.]|nr:hypothetical protein [Pedosphaera sp.]